jgi:DNA-binding response OmpR family regulator
VRSLTILVVEDNQEFCRFVCSLLKSKAEFRVEVAADGLEAVQKAQELQPDLILLDIGLPKLQGIEVARRVRTLIPPTRILFVSALTDPDVVGEALILGSGYIHKPSVQNDLLPAVEAVLQGKRFVSRDLGLGTKTDAPDSVDGSP